MNSLIRYFINRSFVVNLISFFVIFAGLVLGSMIRRDVIPPFEFKTIQVSINLPGASATEVEKYLAYPVENVLKGLPHATEVTTTSRSGSLRVYIYFTASHKEMNESVELVRSRINSIAWQLPQQSRDINVRQDKVTSVFHVGIALENFEETNTTHRLIAKRFAEKMRAIPGIIDAFVEMNAQNLYIKLDQKKISANEISIAEIRSKIQQSLTFAPIGKVDFNEKSFTIEVERPAEAIEAFNNLAIRGNRSGDILRLGDIAKIGLEVDEIKTKNRFDGKPSIVIYTRKDVVTDSIDLKAKVDKLVEEENKTLKDGLKATVFIDAPFFIEDQLNNLKSNGLSGLILVLLVLTLFFNWKLALATSFGIPISYCGTLIALYAFNISIDIISMVGMILVLGILVDDAIIIAERYMENLEEGMEPKDAAYEASRDLMIPVTGTVLTTIFAFVPMILVPSEMAIVFYAIPIVIITSLGVSWIESFFILPNHLAHFIKRNPNFNKETSFYQKVRNIYQNSLRQALKLRYAVVIVLVGFFVASVWVAKNKIQQSFNFNPSLESLVVTVVLKENISLEHTEKLLKPIEERLLTLPKDKFKSVHTNIGEMWGHGRMYEGYRYAKIYVYISESVTHPTILKKVYTDILTKDLKPFQTADFEELTVSQEMNDQNEVKKDMVTIDVSGNEDVEYFTLKESVLEQIKTKKLHLEPVKEVNEIEEKWVFTPNTIRLAQHQMDIQSLTQQLRSLFVPHELMQIRLDGEAKWIYTQVDRKKHITKAELNKLVVLNALGLTVPLTELGAWSKKSQLATIQHKDGKRYFSFDLTYKKSDTMNVTHAKAEAQKITDHLREQFPTYKIDVKDSDRAEANSRAWAVKVAIFCIVLVMFTIALILGSVSLSLIVGLPIPFGLMGIVWALYLHDMQMGMMSLIGLLGTVGVSVNNSLIMVDQILKRGSRAKDISREDIVLGAGSRLRAIMLTTITTLVGVFPMAYGIGGESGFTQPLAFSLGWGLFSSTFLTLFALPAFIDINRDFSRLFSWIGNKVFRTKDKATIVELTAVHPVGDEFSKDELPQTTPSPEEKIHVGPHNDRINPPEVS